MSEDIGHLKETTINTIMNKLKIEVNVLHAIMEDWVGIVEGGANVVIRDGSPIRIEEGIEMQRGTMTEKKSMGDSTLQVANELFQGLPIRRSRAMHELRELVDRERDVRVGEAEVLEATNELTKDSGICEGRAIREN
ncbi:hypothetical protein L3X38_032995 [Prunus dulcis]|uniref:Uncharacterized protein n=1 Tax=Prunus dulcis TaxID=3755 RepID=A0AAD4VGT4_PRUDU|nr:hypothetical protein L3X38_032995 [Prunus dulcis]